MILAPQQSSQWRAPQFVWQVRRELTTQLCGADTETCTSIERGGLDITTTLDMRLQGIAEKWVKAATVVPNAKAPRAAAKALGLTYEPWMDNLRSKDLHNGALVAMDYQTGELVAYVGSADPNARKGTKKFQPNFDVLADGWRQPGSAFKPVVYSTGIGNKSITAASMFMDVVTNFGGGYTPTDADNLERGPVRMRDALMFSLNIPAVKAGQVIGNDAIQAQAEKMGIQFQNGEVNAGMSFPLGVEVVHPLDLIRAYGVLGDKGRLADQTTIIAVADSNGKPLVDSDGEPRADEAGRAGARQGRRVHHHRHPGRQHEPAGRTRSGASSRSRTAAGAGRRRSRPAPATRRATSTPTATSARPTTRAARTGSSRSPSAPGTGTRTTRWSARARPLFSIEVTTYVWQGFLEEATKGWSINGFGAAPDTIDRASVDPWTGLAAGPRGPSVEELFIVGTRPGAVLSPDARCGVAILSNAGFEDEHAAWLAADRGWLTRAEHGPGNARRARGHAYRLLLQRPVHALRQVVGSAGRRRWAAGSRARARRRRSIRARSRSSRPTRRPCRRWSSTCAPRRPSRPPTEAPDRTAHGGADTGAHRGADGTAHARADAGADPRADARRARRVLAGRSPAASDGEAGRCRSQHLLRNSGL